MLNRFFSRPHLVVAVSWLCLNAPLLLGIRVLPGDAMNEFYPMMYFNVHSIRAGLAPWWNPDIFAGYPQIADPQAMLFSPLMMAWMLLRASPGMTWFVIGALLHVLLGGLAMVSVLRRLEANTLGATLGAVVFMAGGVAASRIQYVPILIAYALLPLALLCLYRVLEAPSIRRGAALGIVAGAILAEPVQLTFLAGIALVVYAAILTVERWPTWIRRDRGRFAAGMLTGGLIAIAMALPQLLLSYAFVTVSNRPFLPLEAATVMSVSWDTLLTFLLPNALHNLRGTYQGPVDPIETFYWIGAIPMLALALGLRRRALSATQRSALVFFGVVASLAVLYMLGGHTPFYGWLYHYLPGVKQFRRPSDAAYLLNLFLAIAVGIAASSMDLSNSRTRRLAFGLSTAWLLLASVTMRGAGESWQPATFVAALLSGAALWRLWQQPKTHQIALWLLVVSVADYRCFGLNGEFNQRGDSARKFLNDPAQRALSARAAFKPGGPLPPRIEALELGAGWKNNVVLAGLQATHGYGPLRWAVWDHWYGPYSDGDGPRPTSAYNIDPGGAMNRLLGVAYVVRPVDRSMRTDGVEFYRDGKTLILSPAGALPRVLTPGKADILPLAELTPVRFEATDFRANLLLTPRDSDDANTAAADVDRCHGSDAALLGSRATNVAIAIDVRATRPSWIVITDPDFPGWTAHWNDEPLAIHRADGFLRAVCVPQGAGTLSFQFSPVEMVTSVLKRPESWR